MALVLAETEDWLAEMPPVLVVTRDLRSVRSDCRALRAAFVALPD